MTECPYCRGTGRIRLRRPVRIEVEPAKADFETVEVVCTHDPDQMTALRKTLELTRTPMYEGFSL